MGRCSSPAVLAGIAALLTLLAWAGRSAAGESATAEAADGDGSDSSVVEAAPETTTGAETQGPSETDEEAARAKATAVYKKGVAAYQRGDYPDAVVYFLRADRIISRPEFSYNIARAYDKLGDAANSLRWYRDYLRRAPNADDRADVSALIEERQLALMEQGLQQMTVLSEPAGATLVVDGQPLGVTPWTGELTPGTHQLQLRLRGHADIDEEAYLPADEAVDVNFVLEPSTGPPVSSDAPEAASVGSSPVSSSPGDDRRAGGLSPVWSWVALGAGGLALGAGAGFEFARRKSEARAREANTQIARAEAYDQMTTRQSTARILVGVGGALVVTGAVLWFVSGDDQATEPAVAFGCAPAGCSLLATGRF